MSKQARCNHGLKKPEYHPCKDCPHNGEDECPFYVLWKVRDE